MGLKPASLSRDRVHQARWRRPLLWMLLVFLLISSVLPAATFSTASAEDDTSGVMAGAMAPDAGLVSAMGSSLTTPAQYTGLGFGGEWHTGDGGIHLRARAYRPAEGRFLQRDTFVGFGERPQSQNRYGYAEGNPVMYSDPSGRLVETIIDIGSAGLSLTEAGAAFWYDECGKWWALGAAALDVAALLAPFVPSVAGHGRRVGKVGDKVVDAVRGADNLPSGSVLGLGDGVADDILEAAGQPRLEYSSLNSFGSSEEALDYLNKVGPDCMWSVQVVKTPWLGFCHTRTELLANGERVGVLHGAGQGAGLYDKVVTPLGAKGTAAMGPPKPVTFEQVQEAVRGTYEFKGGWGNGWVCHDITACTAPTLGIDAEDVYRFAWNGNEKGRDLTQLGRRLSRPASPFTNRTVGRHRSP